MTNHIDTSRHITVFDPEVVANKRIDVIGVGSVGSKIAIELSKLGVSNLQVWDHDIVMPHNISNQSFGLKDIGRPKVLALQEFIEHLTGLKVTTHQEEITKPKSLGHIIFLCVDSLDTRKKIWTESIIWRSIPEFMIDTRMGIDLGAIYTVRTKVQTDYDHWLESITPDSQALVSACGATSSIGATSSLVASFAIWQFIKYVNTLATTKNQSIQVPDLETQFSLNPLSFISFQQTKIV